MILKTFRNCCFVLFGLIIFGCASPADPHEVVLTGVLDNYSNEVVELDFFRDFINNDRKVVEVYPDETGVFSQSFQVEQVVLGTLTVGRESIPVYLEPGRPLQIQATVGQLIRSAEFSESIGLENQMWKESRSIADAAFPRSLVNEKIAILAPDAYLAYADSMARVKLDFVIGHPDGDALSADFLQFYQTQILAEKSRQLLDYPQLRARMAASDDLPGMPGHYYDFLQEATRPQDYRLHNLTYVNFLLAYLDYKRTESQRTFDADKSGHEINYILAGDYLTGHSADYMQALSMSREMHSGDMDTALEMLDDYRDRVAVDGYLQRVETALEKLRRVWAGNPAPDFTMTDINGQTFSLSDYQGKVVYLKFWASWCGPCMREVPPAAELKKRFAGEDDLVFMYVSIDVDPRAWEQQVERHGISGIHARTPGRERGAPALYNVRWIPSFFIIGKDGRIVDHRPPYPSHEGIDEALRAALSE